MFSKVLNKDFKLVYSIYNYEYTCTFLQKKLSKLLMYTTKTLKQRQLSNFLTHDNNQNVFENVAQFFSKDVLEWQIINVLYFWGNFNITWKNIGDQMVVIVYKNRQVWK